MKILISGGQGFIGANISTEIKNIGLVVNHIKFSDDLIDIENKIIEADIIIHCSGVSRSENEIDFFNINFFFTSIISSILLKTSNKKVIFFSSIHYDSQTIYGISKRYGEHILNLNGNKHSINIIRLPGIFGEGCKPNYVSVVSTFAYDVINNKQSSIVDADKNLRLLYIKDLTNVVISLINESLVCGNRIIENFPEIINITVNEIHNVMNSFENASINIDDLTKSNKKFYNTYKFISEKYGEK